MYVLSPQILGSRKPHGLGPPSQFCVRAPPYPRYGPVYRVGKQPSPGAGGDGATLLADGALPASERGLGTDTGTGSKQGAATTASDDVVRDVEFMSEASRSSALSCRAHLSNNRVSVRRTFSLCLLTATEMAAMVHQHWRTTRRRRRRRRWCSCRWTARCSTSSPATRMAVSASGPRRYAPRPRPPSVARQMHIERVVYCACASCRAQWSA